MRLSRRQLIGAAVIMPFDARAESPPPTPMPTPAAGSSYLQLLAPPSAANTTNLVGNTRLKVGGAQVFSTNYAITDAAAEIPAAPFAFKARAPGMANVEVFTHDKVIFQGAPAADGSVTATLDFSKEPLGPLVLQVDAWNDGSSGQNPEIHYEIRLTLFITSGAKTALPGAPAGVILTSATPIFDEEWTEGINPAVWTFTKWGQGENQNFGDAVFEAPGGPHNTMTTNRGFLRIRAIYDSAVAEWFSGLLSTGFEDGHVSKGFLTGYFEAEMLLPAGAGAWPAFWMLDQASLRPSDDSIEIDIMEAYGGFPSSYHVTVHNYTPNGDAPQSLPSSSGYTTPADTTFDFHRFGVNITTSQITFYYDDENILSCPLKSFPSGTPLTPFYLLVNLAMGGGWPNAVPEAGYYDLWVKRITVRQ